MATVKQKAPSEQRILPFYFANRIPVGVTATTWIAFASRKNAGTTTQLYAGNSVEASTIQLKAHPGVGAMLIVDPAGSAEETFKVSAVSGASQPFTCTLSHTAEFAHSVDTNVNYEPGETANILVAASGSFVGTQVFLTARRGADGQTYRVSVLGSLDNGETDELEMDLQVVEFVPVAADTQTVQVDEVRDIAHGFDDPLDLLGVTLSSAVAFASREESLTTHIAAASPVAITDPAVVLDDNPGVGALLTVNPTGNTQEKWKVSAVGAGPPYSCTINPVAAFAHNAGETVTYAPGVSARLLTSSTATILGTEAIVRKRRGAAGKTYRLTLLGTLSDSQIISHAIFINVVES